MFAGRLMQHIAGIVSVLGLFLSLGVLSWVMYVILFVKSWSEGWASSTGFMAVVGLSVSLYGLISSQALFRERRLREYRLKERLSLEAFEFVD